MSALAEFLFARFAEAEAREIAEHRAWFTEGLSGDQYVAAAIAHGKLTWVQTVRLSWSLRALAWGMACEPPFRWMGFGWLARVRAADFADHPDYREEWRP